MSDVEASCFYHPDKQAVTTCSNCGRFLCSLCDIELNNRHMCPACLESGKKKRRIKDLENHRFRYDKLVLLLALLPILLWPFTLITAPLTVIIAIKYWNAPSSIIKKSRFRLILALIPAGIQIVAWSFVIYKFLSMLL
jgi:hypothetical protein